MATNPLHSRHRDHRLLGVRSEETSSMLSAALNGSSAAMNMNTTTPKAQGEQRDQCVKAVSE
eukprot:scaffold7802_cov71-Cyclotella_meneghiniana.AAC.18